MTMTAHTQSCAENKHINSQSILDTLIETYKKLIRQGEFDLYSSNSNSNTDN